MTAYDDALARRVAATAPVALSGGSGYFAARSATLDPSLFDARQHLLPDVRATVQHLFYSFMSRQVAHPQAWTTLWICGSGATTAWDADRESNGDPGDLDVLVGIDYELLRSLNPAFNGSPDDAIAHEINQRLHDGLWPSTARYQINSSRYEVTYYVNDGVGMGRGDILAINPYAAYDLRRDEWTQPPVVVPQNFSADYFSAHDRAVVDQDTSSASDIAERFNSLSALTKTLDPSSPQMRNVLSHLHEVVGDGAHLFSTIHDNRTAAFQGGGKGYLDPANFRWQSAKSSGAVSAMRTLKQIDEQAHSDIGLSGGCANVQHLLLIGALANGEGLR
jgi:hypothetical protein